jgi:hypothetical protein
MSEEKKQATVPMQFKWITTSPEPHDVTMRNSLEPVDLLVTIDVPLKKEYIYNVEPVIQSQIQTDFEGGKPVPTLTAEGLRYVVSQLSLQNAIEPVVENLDDENWDDDESDVDFDDDDDFEDDDEDWEDE